jgi:hypothetical protein
MAEQERDPRPVGDWDVSEQGEVTDEPDNARADDQSHNREETDEEPNV